MIRPYVGVNERSGVFVTFGAYHAWRVAVLHLTPRGIIGCCRTAPACVVTGLRLRRKFGHLWRAAVLHVAPRGIIGCRRTTPDIVVTGLRRLVDIYFLPCRHFGYSLWVTRRAFRALPATLPTLLLSARPAGLFLLC